MYTLKKNVTNNGHFYDYVFQSEYVLLQNMSLLTFHDTYINTAYTFITRLT